jgi:hypothetical protein
MGSKSKNVEMGLKLIGLKIIEVLPPPERDFRVHKSRNQRQRRQRHVHVHTYVGGDVDCADVLHSDITWFADGIAHHIDKWSST